MAQQEPVLTSGVVQDLMTPNFYCVSGLSMCCDEKSGFKESIQLPEESYMDSSALWAEDPIEVDEAFTLEAILSMGAMNESFTDGEAFALVFHNSGMDVLGTDHGYEGIAEPMVPAVLFTKFKEDDGSPNFAISMPSSSEQTEVNFVLDQDEHTVKFEYDGREYLNVYIDDKSVLSGSVDISNELQSVEATFGFTLSGYNKCAENLLDFPNGEILLTTAEEQEDELEEAESEDESEDEPAMEVDEDPEMETPSDSDEDPVEHALIQPGEPGKTNVILSEVFKKEKLSWWSFLPNLFGTNGEKSQMHGLYGPTLGTKKTGAIRVRLTDQEGETDKAGVGAGWQYKFSLEQDMTDVKLTVSYRTNVGEMTDKGVTTGNQTATNTNNNNRKLLSNYEVKQMVQDELDRHAEEETERAQKVDEVSVQLQEMIEKEVQKIVHEEIEKAIADFEEEMGIVSSDSEDSRDGSKSKKPRGGPKNGRPMNADSDSDDSRDGRRGGPKNGKPMKPDSDDSEDDRKGPRGGPQNGRPMADSSDESGDERKPKEPRGGPQNGRPIAPDMPRGGPKTGGPMNVPDEVIPDMSDMLPKNLGFPGKRGSKDEPEKPKKMLDTPKMSDILKPDMPQIDMPGTPDKPYKAKFDPRGLRGDVVVALDGKQRKLSTCKTTSCNQRWVTKTISLGDLKAGNHSIQLGSKLYVTSTFDMERRFDTRFDKVKLTGKVVGDSEEP